MANPDDLERRFMLPTAAARHDELRVRDALASAEDDAPATAGEPENEDEA